MGESICYPPSGYQHQLERFGWYRRGPFLGYLSATRRPISPRVFNSLETVLLGLLEYLPWDVRKSL